MASRQLREVALSNDLWCECDPARHEARDRAARRAAAGLRHHTPHEGTRTKKQIEVHASVVLSNPAQCSPAELPVVGRHFLGAVLGGRRSKCVMNGDSLAGLKLAQWSCLMAHAARCSQTAYLVMTSC